MEKKLNEKIMEMENAPYTPKTKIDIIIEKLNRIEKEIAELKISRGYQQGRTDALEEVNKICEELKKNERFFYIKEYTQALKDIQKTIQDKIKV